MIELAVFGESNVDLLIHAAFQVGELQKLCHLVLHFLDILLITLLKVIYFGIESDLFEKSLLLLFGQVTLKVGEFFL